MVLISIFFPIFIIICFYLWHVFKFSLLSKKIFHNYLSLINLKTDWKYSFLENLCEETRNYFNATFISFTKLINPHLGKMIISSGDKKISILSDSIEKEKYHLQKKKHRYFLFVYSTENVLIHKNQKNFNTLKSNFLKYSFMIPIFFENDIEEILISLYFDNIFSTIIAYFKFILIRKRISYFYVGIFKNFYKNFENSTEFLLEEIEDYIAISLDKEEKIVAWNKGAEKLFGYRSIEIIGQNFTVLFNYGEENSFEKALSILNLKNNVKFFVTLKDRMYIPIKVELKITKNLTLGEELLGYNVFVKDITKEEIFKENIQQHSFINYTILENTQDGIIILDSSDKIIFYNDRVRIILDNSMNLFGIPGKKIFPRKFGEEFERTVHRLKKSKLKFIDIDYCFENKYYNVRFFQIYRNSDDKYGGVIVFFIDESIKMVTMIELEEKKEALEHINKNLLNALTSAKIIQENLIPKNLPNTKKISMEAIYLLSDGLGGDFYYSKIIKIEEREYCVSFISDVSGHGISSSMMNVMVKDVYATYIDNMKNENSIEPADFLYLLNKKLLDLNISESKFITCIISIVDFQNQEIKICSAGHTLPYFIRDKKVVLLDFKKAIPLGILDSLELETYTLSYKKEDRFIMYTDGFLDLFETNDLKPLNSACIYLEKNKNSSLAELKNLLIEKYMIYKKKQLVSVDDLTILMIEFK